MSKFGSLFRKNKQSKKERETDPTNFKEKKSKRSRPSRINQDKILESNQHEYKTNMVEPVDNSPQNSDQFKYEVMKSTRASVFQPRTTLVEPCDNFPYKLGRDSVPRRSTLYHGVDFDQAKYLTDDQLRRSIQRPREDHERPSTSRDYQYSHPYRESGELLKENRVDLGKRDINDGYNIYERSNADQRTSSVDPNRKTVVRFRPHSVAHSKPSELSKLMLFRADQMEHKLVLGKNVRSIPLKHLRPVPTLLTDDGKLLQPIPEGYVRKSSLKPEKNAKILNVSMTEIESVGGIPRKSIVQVGRDSNRVEDIMPSLRKSIHQNGIKRRSTTRKSISPDDNLRLSLRRSTSRDGKFRPSIRRSITRNENEGGSFQKSLIVPGESLRSSTIRKSVVQDGNVRPSIRSSKVQEDIRKSIPYSLGSRNEKRYSVIKIINSDYDINNEPQRFSRRSTDPNHYVPVIPARITTSKTFQRLSVCPTRHDRASFDSKITRGSRIINRFSEEPGRKSVVLSEPYGPRGRNKHSIVVFNVENQTSPYLPKPRHPPSFEDEKVKIEPYRGKTNSQSRSSSASAGPILHLRSSNNHEHDTESALMKKYSEYYNNFNSPMQHAYTDRILNPSLIKENNQTFKNKYHTPKSKISQSELGRKDFCGLTETQEIDPHNLKSFSNVNTFPSDAENDIDLLCFSRGKVSVK